MPNFRRRWVQGGTIFFTVVTAGRAPILCGEEARAVLSRVIGECRARWPFDVEAWVLLPDHLHSMWVLPPAEADYAKRWGWIKKEFTKAWLAAGGQEQPLSPGQTHDARRGVWQPRFWDHAIRDEDDFERHFDYIHYNPVKHGLARCVHEWPYSTFHRYVKAGAYPVNWGCSCGKPTVEPMKFDDLDETAME